MTAWTCSWSMVGKWLVQTGDREGEPYSGQLSFHAEEEAKARLIAAAPALLKAAEVAVEAMSLHGALTDDMERAEAHLVAAIAKATGR